jgi:hypothetical protein
MRTPIQLCSLYVCEQSVVAVQQQFKPAAAVWQFCYGRE